MEHIKSFPLRVLAAEDILTTGRPETEVVSFMTLSSLKMVPNFCGIYIEMADFPPLLSEQSVHSNLYGFLLCWKKAINTQCSK